MSQTSHNQLFPVFLKLNQLKVLIVGGGTIALEKLQAIVANSPLAEVTIIALSISPKINEIASENNKIKLHIKAFEDSDLEGFDLVIAAVGDINLAITIQKAAKNKGILINAADKPELCDFYLGSIVQKGHLKIAISTNGKSPTMAKRVKEILNDVFPDETQEVLENLYRIRQDLKGNFEHKVKTLNAITKDYKFPNPTQSLRKKVLKASLFSSIAIVLMIFGHLLFSYLPFNSINDLYTSITNSLDNYFWLYILGGFIAQMIDGALGMAYGVSVTTFLLSLGIPVITPAVASASMHASEIFTTGSSSLVYMRYKNVNKKLFKKLLVPGIIGAVLGSVSISFISKENVSYIKPLVAIYTLVLGVLIITRALNINLRKPDKIKRIFPVAFIGGYLDSLGGGGWGPIVTTSLVAGGRNLRYSIGSSHLAKFFVAIVSTLTFFLIIGISHWQIIFGIVIGGMLAAPLSIFLSNKIPTKKGLLLVGTLVILISIKTIFKL